MAVNFALIMVIYMLSRWVFYFINIDSFHDVTFTDMLIISRGGLRFDLSALCYLNMLYIVLQVLPLKCRHTVRYQKVSKLIFVFVNSLGLVANAADMVYYEFGGRRSTSTIFSEYGGENNLGTILLNSLTAYWPVWLFGIATILAITLFYYNPIKPNAPERSSYPSSQPARIYYPIHTAVFVVVLTLTIGGARGGFGLKMHPMHQDSATIYCRKPQHAALVLNTPFTIITTLDKTGYKDPNFFPDEQLDYIFNPIKTPFNSVCCDSTATSSTLSSTPNIIVFLLESFSSEYTGFYNKERDSSTYEGYTPFLDSLISESYSFRYSFANGTRSVDCMPAVFAGIPRYIDPFCYFIYANNILQALPQMLRDEGYTTAFFHGAPNTTLGFKSFTNAIGFESYYGMDEYPNSNDFDGTWAIFDEPYLQYFARQCDTLAAQGAPFLATVFTASSHEPFRIPDQHKNHLQAAPYQCTTPSATPTTHCAAILSR